MKVLQVIPAVAPRYGGPSRQAIERSRALLGHGLEVLLATTSADGSGELPVPHNRTVDHEGVPALFFRRDFSESLKYSSGFSRWIAGAAPGFDVVHIDAVFSHVCWSTARACAAADVPYVVRPLGTLDTYTYGQKTFRKRMAWHLFASRMMRNAGAIMYSTGAEKEDVEARFGLRRGTVIPNGVAPLPVDWERTALRAGLSDLCSHPFIACVCRLDPIKGLEDLIRTFAAAVREAKKSDWRLVIAGDGEADYVARLRRLAESAGVGAAVVFIGWVSAAERTRLLAAARLFALFSWHENFGIAVVEAMQCGTPVLVSDQVQICDRIAAARAGWVVRRDPEAMRHALVEAIRDEEERARRGRCARTLVAGTYSWDKVAAQHAELLRRLANGKRVG